MEFNRTMAPACSPITAKASARNRYISSRRVNTVALEYNLNVGSVTPPMIHFTLLKIGYCPLKFLKYTSVTGFPKVSAEKRSSVDSLKMERILSLDMYISGMLLFTTGDAKVNSSICPVKEPSTWL